MTDAGWAFMTMAALQLGNMFVSWNNGRKQNIALKQGSDLHDAFNSKSDKQAEEFKARLDKALAEIAALRGVLAATTGTVEDKVRSEMAHTNAADAAATPAPQVIAAKGGKS